MTFREQWRRVSRARPCPVCERPDWCLIAADDGAAICARVESPKRVGEAGWLHRLRMDDWRPARRFVRSVPVPSTRGRFNLAELAAACRRSLDPGLLDALALDLGLSVASLDALGIGWSAVHRAWSFPMLTPAGDVLGIRLRQSNGFKFSVAGGREGLFLPSASDGSDSRLLIAEGPTDTAALLDMGFVSVAGRPSCTGGIRLLVDLVRLRRPPEAVIVADADEPGRRGASNLAAVLLVHVPVVRVIGPPEGIKDARAWLRTGGTRKDVEQATAAAPARRLAVRTVAVGKGR